MLVDVFDKLDKNLRVGLTLKSITFLDEFFFEYFVVFNDAVVDHRKALRGGIVRVRIDVIGLAMGGPAGMTNSDLGLDITVFGQVMLQFGYLSFLFVNTKTSLIEQGHACRVISSVF